MAFDREYTRGACTQYTIYLALALDLPAFPWNRSVAELSLSHPGLYLFQQET